MSEHIRIALDLIHPSPTNPRKTFDRTELDELAASIRVHRVVQPIKVRPHPTLNHGSYMLVIGERRWRASAIAGETDIPAIVEDITETQALEQQLVENTQRVDVHPLEEAQSYQDLLDHHQYTMELLVEKTGRSRAHLYGRLKLLKLAPGPRKAFLEGKLGAAIAELIARIPVAKLQEQACKDVLGQTDQGDLDRMGILGERIEGHGEKTVDLPLSFRAAQALIHRRYSLKLELAKFDTYDATLVEGAGTCAACPHRSGNQPELALPGVASPKDLCTNPPCFEAKTKATWKEKASAAKAKGMEVIEGKKAEHVFGHDGVNVTPNSPYIELTTELPYNLQRQPGKGETFGRLLGKRAHEVPRVLVQDETGAPRELLDKAAAIEMLKDLGKIDKPTKPKPSKEALTYVKQNEKDAAKRALKEAAFVRILQAVSESALEDPGKKESAWWRWIAHTMLDEILSFGEIPEPFLVRRGITEGFDKALGKEIDGLKSAVTLRAFVIELMIGCQVEGVTDGTRDKRDRFDEACNLFDLDFDEALGLAKEAAKLEEQVANAKDPAKKKGGGK